MNKKSSFANQGPTQRTQNKTFILLVVVVLLSLGIVILDFLIPLGYAVWLFYLIPIYLSFWSSRNKIYWLLPAFYTVFIVLKIFSGKPGIEIYIAVFNRVLGILLVWVTAFILTSRNKAEMALQRSEEIVQSVNSFILTADSQGRLDYINNYGQQIFDHDAEWYHGKNIFTWIIPAETFNALQSENMLTGILANPEAYRTIINRNRKQSGEYIWVSWTIRFLTDEDGQLRGIFAVGNDITELKSSQEEAEKGQNMLEGLLSYIPEAIHIVNKDRIVVRVSTYNEQLTGYPVAELQGISLDEWYRHIPFYHINGRTRGVDGELPTLRVLHSAEVIKNEEWMIQTAQGEMVDIAIDAGPVRNSKGQVTGAVVTWHDVTAYKKAIVQLEAAKESERRERELLQTIINSIPVMITIHDRDSNELYVNKYLTDITGWTNDDARQGDLFSAIYPDPAYRQSVSDYMQALTPGFRDLVMMTKDGVSLDASWANVQLPDGRLVGIGLDIRERKRAEEALTRNITELKKYQSSLELSNRELEQFAYVASHDLQEPLRIVASYTELLERRYKESFDAKGRGFLKYIVDGASRMQHLIQDLLDFSRVGRLDTERHQINMNNLAHRVIANFSQLIQETNARVTHDSLPSIWANETNMTQLLQNLIGNALKFRKKDVPPVVYVSVKKQDKEWLFAVQDNGIGIDPQYFDKLFVIFQRLHPMGEYPGTGIGLAIVKKIVNYYGGRIWVSSRLGGGATFYFTLPQSG